MKFSKSALIAFVAAAVQVSAYPAHNVDDDGRGYSPMLGLFEAVAERARHAILALPVSIVEGQGIFNPFSEPVHTNEDCPSRTLNRVPPEDCKNCVGIKACVWNKQHQVCMDRPGRLSDKHVDSTDICQKLYEDSTTGRAELAWKRMAPHVFGKDKSPNPWSGRHTMSAFREANKKWPGVCDHDTHLCVFHDKSGNPKSVFGYVFSDAMVEQVCRAAIALNLKGTGSGSGSWVVESPRGGNICVRHQVEGQGSCFPDGVNTSQKNAGETCEKGTGNDPETPFVAANSLEEERKIEEDYRKGKKVQAILDPPIHTTEDCPSRGVGLQLPNNCLTCLEKTACAWNKVAGGCVDKPSKPADKYVTSPAICQKMYEESPAGKVDIAWRKMAPHVFGTENNPDKWSGRHTITAFRKSNGAYPGQCDHTSKICIFTKGSNVKTVFGYVYTDAMVEAICRDAIRLNQARSSGSNSYVVNGPRGRLCVRHQVEGDGSCFPWGVNIATGNLGDTCNTGPDNTPAQSFPAANSLEEELADDEEGDE